MVALHMPDDHVGLVGNERDVGPNTLDAPPSRQLVRDERRVLQAANRPRIAGTDRSVGTRDPAKSCTLCSTESAWQSTLVG